MQLLQLLGLRIGRKGSLGPIAYDTGDHTTREYIGRKIYSCAHIEHDDPNVQRAKV
jgi:hypothetical protein